MREELSKLLDKALGQLGLNDLHPEVTFSSDNMHGDYATNVAFQAGKALSLKPLEAAQKIADEISANKPDYLVKIEAVAPGFINFTLDERAVMDKIATSGFSEKTIESPFTGQKIMVEFTDPNPFKEFHIGHLYSNIVGESLARLMESQGAEVRRVNYQGDIGLHVAKALFGLQQKMQTDNLSLQDLEKKSLEERAKFLGGAYALGATKFEEDENTKKEIIEINKKVYASAGSAQGASDPEIKDLYEKGRQWSLDYFETIYHRLGTEFEAYYFESKAGPIGLALVKEYLLKGVFEESQGAVIFNGEEHGLHSRVFINSLGLPTYEAKELGLAITKYNDYKFDRSIMVTGNEINEYFRVLLKALSLIRPEIAEKTKHISHGMVRLPEGKMSSRTGDVITGEWLMNEAKNRAGKKIAEVKSGEEASKSRVVADEAEKVAEMVGLGAIKYALLKNGIGKDISFSFDESISFEGNAGPYLQYTYVRTRSILEKAEKEYSQDFTNYKPEKEERELLVQLIHFDEVVAEASEKFSPNLVALYLFELAQEFNLFYQKYPILKEKGDVRDFRLFLTEKVGYTLKKGLRLLGIETPEKM